MCSTRHKRRLIISLIHIFFIQPKSIDIKIFHISCNIPGYPSSGPRGCQVTTARCTPTPHPSPSIHIGWVVASGNRTPNLTFNTPGKLVDASSCADPRRGSQGCYKKVHFFVTSLSPRACQVCSPIHPNPSPFLRPFILRWVVARRGRTPYLTFNTLSTRQMLPVVLHFFVTSLSPRACQVWGSTPSGNNPP